MDSGEESEGEGERGFGQRPPPLSITIKRILDQYPDGQILKELLQNAEDAKAKELKLTIDCREFGTDTIFKPRSGWATEDLSICQGPSLLAWNDAEFSENDWEGIQKPYQSVKEFDPSKIGRFGIGFNVVYHLTDFPWLASGKKIGVFDPRVTGIFGIEPGKQWNFDNKKQREKMESLDDQFRPFQFIIGERGTNPYVKGSLFRFPLRKTKNDLSADIYTVDKIPGAEKGRSLVELFDTFIAEGDRILLFLESVEKISLWKWQNNDEEPAELFSVIAQRGVNGMKKQHRITVTDKTGAPTESTKDWLVIHFEATDPAAQQLANEDQIKALPKIGFAAEIMGTQTDPSYTFCFLPLPFNKENETNLPVHIHGYFCLSDSRRTMRWPSTDNQNDKRTQWNDLLVQTVSPQAYRLMLRTAVELATTDVSKRNWVPALWPHLVSLNKHWQPLATALYQETFNENLFWSEILQQWVSASNGIFFDRENCRNDEWVSVIEKLCKLQDLPLITGIDMRIPNDFAMIHTNYQVKTLNQKLICKSYGALNECQKATFLSAEKICLLQYLLSDTAIEASDLSGLDLLPLADGNFVPFKSAGDFENQIFVTTDQIPEFLFPGMKNRFLQENIVKTDLDRIIRAG